MSTNTARHAQGSMTATLPASGFTLSGLTARDMGQGAFAGTCTFSRGAGWELISIDSRS